MKKNLTKITAIILAACMLLTFTAAAATKYYCLTVTLSGPDANGVTQSVSRSTGNYELGSNSLLATLGYSLYAASEEGLTVDDEIQIKFDGTGLNDVYNELCEGAMEAAAGSSHPTWDNWVNNCVDTSEYKAVLLDEKSTIEDLANVGGVITAHYTDFMSRIYTVTISVNIVKDKDDPEEKEDEPEEKEDEPEEKEEEPEEKEDEQKEKEPVIEKEPTVIVSKDDGGKTTVDNTAPEAGDTVTITAEPDDGNMVNYIDVRDENGGKVPLTYEGNGVYTFVMPEGIVTVTGKYRKVPVDPSITGVSELLDVEHHIAYMIGDDKGNFRPKDSITRAEVAQIFYNLLKVKPEVTGQCFDDVTDDKWYAKAVNTLAPLGILKGVDENNFEPNRAITRAEFAAICVRFANTVIEGNMFDDVPDDHWARDAINTAAEFGWIAGTGDGNFEPNRQITREEAAKIINCMLYHFGDQIAIDGGNATKFPDVNDKMWSWYEIGEATTGHDYEEEVGFVHEDWE